MPRYVRDNLIMGAIIAVVLLVLQVAGCDLLGSG